VTAILQEELQLALFQAPHGENLFLDRVMNLEQLLLRPHFYCFSWSNKCKKDFDTSNRNIELAFVDLS
jgi:hypothetical protein